MSRPSKKQKSNTSTARFVETSSTSTTTTATTTATTTTTTPSFGTNERLLSMTILPGEHTLSAYAPRCHYIQSGTLNKAAAKYWSAHNRSQLLGQIQAGTLEFNDAIAQWDRSLFGAPPEQDDPEAELGIISHPFSASASSSTLPSSQRVFLRPALTLPTTGFFEQDLPGTAAGTAHKGLEIPLMEVGKYKLADYLSFNHYSYYFPRVRSNEWQRNSKLFGNRGSVVVTVKESMTLRCFLQEFIAGSALWKGGQLWATDLIVGTNAIEWQMGKFIPSQSQFKVVVGGSGSGSGSSQSITCGDENSMGSGAWPDIHQDMRKT